ncbi:HNH endonuclease signature motif containing protein [Blastococcus sp. Marseille-P5729]|uniref:HNH endonuclease signature motif containing protein n=1 Tax=Blastococcus sp. Marseille-P5729 TaxID=2086582 RepID=UPI000D114196|nr:HNH endonuclease signature motif containing protein [Blastococcus sp. Marseille-P5729]
MSDISDIATPPANDPKHDRLPAGAVPDAELDEQLDRITGGLESLVEAAEHGDFAGLGPDGLIALARRVESIRTRLITLDCHVIEAAEDEQLHERQCVATTAMALAEVLRISRPEANARVARRKQLISRNGFSFGAYPPELPVLAQAVRNGSVTTEHVTVIGKAIRKLLSNPSIDVDTAAQAEEFLVNKAASFGPDDVKTLADKLDDVLLPDGAIPQDRVAQARRSLSIGPQRQDGTHHITGFLTRGLKALFDAAVGPLAAPRPADDEAGPDDRTAGQRTHDALEDACRRLLDSAGTPAAGGTAASVHITIDLDQLLDALRRLKDGTGDQTGRASGQVAGGERLSWPEIARLAHEAQLIPTWISKTDGILAFGRTRRIATEAQTLALITRDRGCSFPGCTAPPDWSQRHHVIPWWNGGKTDIDNLTLVCSFHHREFERRGWQVEMHSGIPIWIPPRWIDPEQRPQINHRIALPSQAELDLLTERTRAREHEPPPDPPDPLEVIDELVPLLAEQLPPAVREQFGSELYLLLATYLGSAPIRDDAASSAAVAQV